MQLLGVHETMGNEKKVQYLIVNKDVNGNMFFSQHLMLAFHISNISMLDFSKG